MAIDDQDRSRASNSSPSHFWARPGWRRMIPSGTAVVMAAMLSACPATSEDVRPPGDSFFFPTGLEIDPGQNALFVANANSDLRYDSGTITLVDLERTKEIAEAWKNSGQAPSGLDCEVSPSSPSTLICNESEFIVEDATVRTGNFATELGMQELADGKARLFAAVRGDPSLTWIDYDPDAKVMECGGGGAIPRCDEDHRLNRMRNDESIGNMASEPFGLYVDSVGESVIITHLAQAAVTLADAPADGSPPVLSDVLGGVFQRDPQTGASSAVGAASRTPGGQIYVTSASESRVQIFSVARVGEALPTLVPGSFFFLDGVQPSDDGRGITFGSDGERAYVINRSPAMLQVLDTSLDETGVPRNELVRAIEVCAGAANLVLGDVGEGDRAYITCFREGQVWAIDPQTGGVDAIVNVGRGPQSIRLSEDKQQLYVTNFLEDTISVIDTEPGSVTQNRVVLKLGRTRQSGGK